MSAGINRVILVGNLGKDAEVRYVQSGQAVCTLRLAVTERRKDGDEWKDHTEWMDVVTFGKTAENAGQYLQKGRQVYVEGRLQTKQYKDKEGHERWRTEVVASQVLFLGGGEQRQGGGSRPQSTSRPGPASKGDEGSPPAADGFIDDPLPF